MRKAGGHFLFTAKPSSHKTLYSWLDGAEVASCEQKIKQGARFVTHRYRWLEGVPLRDGKDGLMHLILPDSPTHHTPSTAGFRIIANQPQTPQ